MGKTSILTFLRYYLPGYKSGGPVRTIANMADLLGDEFEFLIVTSDRDALDRLPYPDVAVNAWNQVGKACVYYMSPGAMTLQGIIGVIRQTPHDVLYLNSFFDPGFSGRPLIARRLGVIPKNPVIMAPRGEFSNGAYGIKAWKKRPFVALTRLARLNHDITWHASSKYEAIDIREAMGSSARKILVAPNLPPLASNTIQNKDRAVRDQVSKVLRVIYLSRISPKKNLAFALRVLHQVQCPTDFNIYGPIDDKAYWRRCQALMQEMPPQVSVRYHGSVRHSEVTQQMASHDLFFLPTLGENYGHVIAEALVAGTPVLISDATPWRDLAGQGLGWDLCLEDGENAFAVCIEAVSQMDSSKRSAWRSHVSAHAFRKLSNPWLLEANRQLFLRTAGPKQA